MQKHKPIGIILIGIFLGTCGISQLTYSLYTLIVEYYLGSSIGVIIDFLGIVAWFWLPIHGFVFGGLEQTYNQDFAFLVARLVILSVGITSMVAMVAILKGLRLAWNLTLYLMLFEIFSSVSVIMLIPRSEHFINDIFVIMILPIISVAIVYYLSKKNAKKYFHILPAS